ncbi:hypothetical protein [Streptomyces corynorhini]|uniref:Uncharacterized protein n=1 Tax=Streptomyces corynorhini TaxID=2282652 RepID=A0A370BBN3_9ACTN|nr:hypothetical protein [Streptomyces corynorhini]RDG39051.1 hypothetical protein DVH02_06125 [Streptomyces corynorhini]
MTRPGAEGPVWDFVVTGVFLGALAGALIFTQAPERMARPEGTEDEETEDEGTGPDRTGDGPTAGQP